MKIQATLLASLLASAPASLLAAPSPTSGTLSEAQPSLSYSGGPLGPSPNATANNQCANDLTSEIFDLTVSLADLAAYDTIRIELAPVPTADMVLSVFDASGKDIGDSDNGATGGRELLYLAAAAGTAHYKVAVCVFAGSAPSYGVTASLSATPPPPPVTEMPGQPHLVTMPSPPDLGNSSGEPSIGYNLQSKRAMYIAGTETLRVTPAESSGAVDAAGSALPLSCPARWDDVSAPQTNVTTLDPILFTNQSLGAGKPGRTFVSQLTGSNSIFVFSDDDGTTWTEGQIGTSNGGVDHQTVSAGPYPAPSGAFTGAPPGNPGYAVYYCSQSVADAFCARSDTGGQTFNPGVPVGKSTALGCSTGDLAALHGHVRIAADGSLAIPFRNCAGQQGFLLSTDAGTTFSARKVPNTIAGETDPQLAWSSPDAQGKPHGYFCMVDGDGHAKAAVTADKGATWSSLYDVGAQAGVKNAVFAQAIAGDADRAACAFIGTTTAGSSGAEDFPGVWYGFVAYTFDGGQSWQTINVTPDDPVQGKGGICTAGTTCGSNRNLLDFNEITLDEKGRVWFGYADGCTSAACVGSGGEQNDFAAKATIARQIGGHSLYAAFDAQMPTVPQEPCLSGTRDAAKASLSWITPYDGGKTITGYRISRATSVNGTYVPLATIGVKNVYDDLTADAGVASYFYKVQAIYDGGDGLVSNVLELPITVPESVCTAPGLTVLTDGANDELDGVTAHDVRSLSLAQPYYDNDDYKIVFTLRATDLSTLPANTVWPVNFCAPSFPCSDPNAGYGATNKFFTVRMSTVAPGTPTAPVFQLVQPHAADTATTTITLPASDGNTYTAAGFITMVVRGSDLGLDKSGRGTDTLSKFQTRVTVSTVVTGGGATPDNMPDGLAGAGAFTTVAPTVCAPNTPPLASLDADVELGAAPLTVTFTGHGTDADAIDTVDTYSLDFGDQTTPAAQSDGAFAPHQYAAPGNYPARLFVVDSRGMRSSNTAEKVISVYGHPVADAGDDFAVREGSNALLSGARSDSANGGTLAYAWTQTAGPPVALNGADTATPSFTAPTICADTVLSFSLSVSALGGSDSDDVNVSVHDIVLPPAANAGPDFIVGRGREATLDASASTSDPCLTASYAWTQTLGPPVALSGADSPKAGFTAPDSDVDMLLGFRVTVTDASGQSSSDEVQVTVNSKADRIIGNNGVGAMNGLALLLLGLAGALRRARGRAGR